MIAVERSAPLPTIATMTKPTKSSVQPKALVTAPIRATSTPLATAVSAVATIRIIKAALLLTEGCVARVRSNKRRCVRNMKTRLQKQQNACGPQAQAFNARSAGSERAKHRDLEQGRHNQRHDSQEQHRKIGARSKLAESQFLPSYSAYKRRQSKYEKQISDDAPCD